MYASSTCHKHSDQQLSTSRIISYIKLLAVYIYTVHQDSVINRGTEFMLEYTNVQKSTYDIDKTVRLSSSSSSSSITINLDNTNISKAHGKRTKATRHPKMCDTN